MTRIPLHPATVGWVTALAALLAASAAQAQNAATLGVSGSVIKNVEQSLKQSGYDPGRVDQSWTPQSELALKGFQRANGLQPTGELDPKTARKLGLKLAQTGGGGKQGKKKQANKKQGNKTNQFLYLTSLGGIAQTETPNTGKLHITGEFGIETAGYFRGAFDFVPEDLDVLQFGPTVRLTLELPDIAGFLKSTSLTVGSANNFWTDDVVPTDQGDVDDWFESDNYVGLATRLGQNWTAGLTYTAFTAPNGVFPTTRELAIAAQYNGKVAGFKFSPQVKATFPVDEADGAFQEGAFLHASVSPSAKPFKLLGQQVTVSVPVELGVGVDGYYGKGTDTTGFLGAGLVGSVPLPIPSDYGNWAVDAQINAVFRDEELEEADPPVSDAGDVVLFGGLALTFAY